MAKDFTKLGAYIGFGTYRKDSLTHFNIKRRLDKIMMRPNILEHSRRIDAQLLLTAK